MTGNMDALEEYLTLRRLIERSDASSTVDRLEAEEAVNDHMMEGFGEDFDPWS